MHPPEEWWVRGTLAVNRPCFLVVDREYPGNISARKLVIETAKFNVITAYSSEEALITLRRFPMVDGIVMDAPIGDEPCAELVRQIREIEPNVPIVVTSDRGYVDCGEVEYHLEKFEPRKLLDVLQTLRPRDVARIEAQDDAEDEAQDRSRS
jgi:DNA-binding response OmpR family regulator